MTQIIPTQQIEQLAYNAGFRGPDLLMATAIAQAESGGNPTAYNPETAAHTPTGSGSRGLWQIYGAAHPNYNNDAFYDPQLNANAAYSVYQAAGNKFTPWSTYTNGTVTQIANSLVGILPAISGAVTNATGAAGSVLGNLLPVSTTDPAGFFGDLSKNIALGAVAWVLILFGFILLVQSR